MSWAVQSLIINKYWKLYMFDSRKKKKPPEKHKIVTRIRDYFQFYPPKGPYWNHIYMLLIAFSKLTLYLKVQVMSIYDILDKFNNKSVLQSWWKNINKMSLFYHLCDKTISMKKELSRADHQMIHMNGPCKRQIYEVSENIMTVQCMKV